MTIARMFLLSACIMNEAAGAGEGDKHTRRGGRRARESAGKRRSAGAEARLARPLPAAITKELNPQVTTCHICNIDLKTMGDGGKNGLSSLRAPPAWISSDSRIAVLAFRVGLADDPGVGKTSAKFNNSRGDWDRLRKAHQDRP
jgi:hypothetical protein